MAGKEITMVLGVDLACERCKKKITRVLEKIKDKMNIETIKFDEKRNAVTISGPFDADKVRRKLCCEAGRIIKGMDVVVVKAPEENKDDGGVEREEAAAAAAAAAAAVDISPLLKKMLEQPKPLRTPCTCSCCCGCSCGNDKQTTRPPAQGVPVPANKSVWPAPPASSVVVVSGHGYDEAAPPSYYGVPVYSGQGWY